MSKNKTILTVTDPGRIGNPDVKLRPDDFDFIVFDKGLEVLWEKAVPCPCRVKGSQGSRSTCKNCGGIGWVFINPVRTRMVLQSMDLKTQYKIYGQENSGTVMVTARKGVNLSFMDRLTVIDSESLFKQVLYPVKNDVGRYVGTTIYPLISIESLFLYEGDSVKLRRLVEGVDFSKDYNVITLNSSYDSLTNPSLSVTYTHNIQYMIVENIRDVRNTYVYDSTGHDQMAKMPVHVLGRRPHYVLDIENLNGDRLFDNSFQE